MAGNWKAAADFVERLVQEYKAKPHAEILQLPRSAPVQRSDAPAGFDVLMEHGPMLNATSSVTFEAARPQLFGLRWRYVVAGFEVTPEGAVTEYPTRYQSESYSERKRRLSW